MLDCKAKTQWLQIDVWQETRWFQIYVRLETWWFQIDVGHHLMIPGWCRTSFDDSRLMSDILWSMTNYLRFHLGDDLVLGSARQYGSYWDIPGGDVKVKIYLIPFIGIWLLLGYPWRRCEGANIIGSNVTFPVSDSGRVFFLGEYSCFWDNRKDGWEFETTKTTPNKDLIKRFHIGFILVENSGKRVASMKLGQRVKRVDSTGELASKPGRQMYCSFS